MGQRLWEVAESGAGVGVNLLGKQADVVRVAQETFELRDCGSAISLHRPTLDFPEGADPERAFTRRQAVVFDVAIKEAVSAETLPDAAGCRTHAGASRVRIPVERKHEQACIDIRAVENGYVRSETVAEPACLDFGANRLPFRRKLLDGHPEMTRFMQP